MLKGRYGIGWQVVAWLGLTALLLAAFGWGLGMLLTGGAGGLLPAQPS